MSEWRRYFWGAIIIGIFLMFLTVASILLFEVGNVAYAIFGLAFWYQAIQLYRDREIWRRNEEFDKRRAEVWNRILTDNSIDEAVRARQIQTMIGIEERTK